MSRLVILAPNWIGDAVMALPTIASVRQWQAHAHLAVAARQSVAPLFSMVPGIDAVVALRGRGGWRDAWRTWADARTLEAGTYDSALLLPNSLHAALLTRAAGIPERWGYAADVRSRMLTRAVPKPRGFLHHAEYYLQLVRVLGASRAPMVAELQTTEDDRERATGLLRELGWDGTPMVAFAPGAAFGLAKRWPPDRMGAVAATLAERLHVTPVLVGTGADRSVTSEVARAYRHER
ncbi:MAG TPA: glycosyltransferase family 9 protein, partial [Vicinamibacterales bacterium]|nr:glycosyltransferase family 9 protein [Vicinamibacterales bacterium]